jgi:hypothetical protein
MTGTFRARCNVELRTVQSSRNTGFRQNTASPWDSTECVRMRRTEWCPLGRFEVPSSPSGPVSEVTFDRVAYPPLRLYLAYFESHTLCSSLYCVRALTLPQSPTRTLTKPSSQSCGLTPVEGIRLPLPAEPQRRCRLQIVGHCNELLLLAEVDLVHSDLSQGNSF